MQNSKQFEMIIGCDVCIKFVFVPFVCVLERFAMQFFHWMSLDNNSFLLLSLCPWHDHDNNIVYTLLVVSFVAVYSVLGCSWTIIRRKFTCDRRRRRNKNKKHNDYDDRTEYDIAKLLRNLFMCSEHRNYNSSEQQNWIKSDQALNRFFCM